MMDDTDVDLPVRAPVDPDELELEINKIFVRLAELYERHFEMRTPAAVLDHGTALTVRLIQDVLRQMVVPKRGRPPCRLPNNRSRICKQIQEMTEQGMSARAAYKQMEKKCKVPQATLKRWDQKYRISQNQQPPNEPKG
jgi:hypothetical protein